MPGDPGSRLALLAVDFWLYLTTLGLMSLKSKNSLQNERKIQISEKDDTGNNAVAVLWNQQMLTFCRICFKRALKN